MALLLAIEPFWGRAIVYEVNDKQQTEISLPMVLSNDHSSTYLEAVDMFYHLQSQLKSRSLTTFDIVVIEVTEAQSDEAQQAILKAAINSGFPQPHMVLYENSRILQALSHLEGQGRIKESTIAVMEIWQNEAFGYILQSTSTSGPVIKFKPIAYYSIESDEEFDAHDLKGFAQQLIGSRRVEAVIIATDEYEDVCKAALGSQKLIFYDSDERQGSILKAKALYATQNPTDDAVTDVADTLEHSLKLIIGNQKHSIAEPFAELPIVFEKVISLDAPASSLEFCRQWSSSSRLESYGRTTFEPRKTLKIKVIVDNLRKIEVSID